MLFTTVNKHLFKMFVKQLSIDINSTLNYFQLKHFILNENKYLVVLFYGKYFPKRVNNNRTTDDKGI